MEFGVGMEVHVSVFLEPTVLQEILMVCYIQLLLYTIQNVSIHVLAIYRIVWVDL